MDDAIEQYVLQTLALLESERASAGVEEVRNRIAGLMLARLRAEAEASGQSLELRTYQRTHPDLVQAQRALYVQNMAGLEKEQATLQGQLRLAREEQQMNQRLFEAGDISRLELMQISPTEGQHILEAKVNPADIGQLRVGQEGTLRLDAFDYSLYGSLPPGSRIRPEDIKPGMTASVDLMTGKRSVLHYIAKPITRAFSGALGQK